MYYYSINLGEVLERLCCEPLFDLVDVELFWYGSHI